jgi:hypothetical protein
MAEGGQAMDRLIHFVIVCRTSPATSSLKSVTVDRDGGPRASRDRHPVAAAEIDAVHVSAPVKISVDAFPNADLTGRVSEIKTGAAGVFSLFPQSNTSGNFQKVTQVIPVKITIDDLQNLPLVPGMKATVKINRG